MSETQSSTPHLVRAEEDRISSHRVVAVGIGSLLVFLVASLIAIRGMVRERAALLPDGPPRAPAEVGQPKIGIVEQQLYERTRTGPQWKADQLRRLESWGWVDRQKGLAHIPVDSAIDLLIAGERP